ncbi:hypothetical protein [Vreelandella boliviensis]|uniref:Uncharacterized protein n=1 Tax=Vreelandella boliviensis LC1 TaxID=1072583 RepID=A0ABX4G4E5_9GAMM|nr:hypothetical protein [Halomonas boliviensis]OZT72520.1 hypothetical protein CE457_19005 [Halomonas boliviensis LC1]
MPYIKSVDISTPSAVTYNTYFNVGVSAVIEFSDLERQLGLSYKTSIALYEIDDRMDVYSIQPNWQRIFLQRAARGDKDDFLGFSPPIDMKADSAEDTITHNFNVRAQVESDWQMEIRALVVCVPETSAAMQWSSQKKIQSVAT